MATEFDQYAFPVRHTEADYGRMVIGLLPKGVIWGAEKMQFAIEWLDHISGGTVYQDTISGTRVIQDSNISGYSGSLLGRALTVIGSELARVEVDAWAVLNASDPGVAVGSDLVDWERTLALPDPGFPAGLSVEDRQRAAHAKLFNAGITQNKQAYIDYAASMGFAITIDETIPEYFESRCGIAVCGFSRCVSSYYAANSLLEITVVSGSGDLDALKAAFQKNKPAHVVIVWIV